TGLKAAGAHREAGRHRHRAQLEHTDRACRKGDRARAKGHRMSKVRTSYVCQSCGAVSSRWQGRCDSCGEWNSIVEEIVDSGVGAGPKAAKANGRPTTLVPLAGETESAARVVTGIGEL